jgi:RNA 3'-phosphate cyclase
MLEIDGAYGEGGGQLLRMAVALSAVRSIPIRIVRIRAGRPTPGLAAQHVAALRAVAALCGGEIEGLEIGSQEVVVRPGSIVAGRHAFDVGTAGSATLVLQASLPVAFAAPGPVTLRIVGGTDVRWSPPVDYFARVFLPLLQSIGGRVTLEVLRRGYYPRGGGVLGATIEPVRVWSPLSLIERGAITRVRGIAHVANLPDQIAKRMKHAAMRRLHGLADIKIEERVYTGEDAVGQGGGVVLWAEATPTILGANSLAERGKSSERAGEEAAAGLRTEIESGASLDIHASDQLVVYLALARAPSEFLVREVSGHLATMAWLIPQFVPCSIRTSAQGSLWRVSVDPQP